MTGVAPVSAVALRQATSADYDQISSLTTRYGIRYRDREEWLRHWVNNPQYLRQENWPIGWGPSRTTRVAWRARCSTSRWLTN